MMATSHPPSITSSSVEDDGNPCINTGEASELLLLHSSWSSDHVSKVDN